MPRYTNGQPSGRGGSTMLTRKQSGEDWGMEDLDDYFGTDISNMDPHSQEFADAMAEEAGQDPPKLPEETDDPNFSSDFTDSGVQTEVDLEDTLEEETEEAGYIPGQEQSPLYSIINDTVSKNLVSGPSKRKASQARGGVGQVGGRTKKAGRPEMVTTSRKASILAP